MNLKACPRTAKETKRINVCSIVNGGEEGKSFATCRQRTILSISASRSVRSCAVLSNT